jgi:hypothetical protein
MSAGVQMLTLRQSSDVSGGTSGLWCGETQPAPQTVALSAPSHGARGAGGAYAFAPAVDAA